MATLGVIERHGGDAPGRRDEQIAEALNTLKRLEAIEELRARCLETRQLVEVSRRPATACCTVDSVAAPVSRTVSRNHCNAASELRAICLKARPLVEVSGVESVCTTAAWVGMRTSGLRLVLEAMLRPYSVVPGIVCAAGGRAFLPSAAHLRTAAPGAARPFVGPRADYARPGAGRRCGRVPAQT